MQDALAAAAEQDAAAAANARQRADQLLAEAEVAAAERMLEAAELEFNSAKRQQAILQQELGQVRAQLCCAVLGLGKLLGSTHTVHSEPCQQLVCLLGRFAALKGMWGSDRGSSLLKRFCPAHVGVRALCLAALFAG